VRLKSRLLTFLFGCILIVPASAQKSYFTPQDSAYFRAYEDTIALYLDSMINCAGADDRIAYNYGIIPRLVSALRHPNSYYYGFDSLRGMFIVNAPDDRFRIFTWQLELEMKSYRHFGAIQMNQGDLKLFPLVDASEAIRNPEAAVLTDSLWFGMVYYKIIKREHEGKSHYFLFGYDENNLLSKIKFIDVLTFNSGRPRFGAPMFEVQRQGKTLMLSRFMLEYSSSAAATLNYFDEYGKIIFDHLVPNNPNSVGIYFTYIPDGTYEGFEWKDGKWVWIEKVFTETQDTPPFPVPFDFRREYPKK